MKKIMITGLSLCLVSLFFLSCAGTKDAVIDGTPPDAANLIRVQGGAFLMGSPETEVNRGDFETQKNVTVAPFFIAPYEVTVGEFRQFIEDTGYITVAETYGFGAIYTGFDIVRMEYIDWSFPIISQDDTHPVVLITWLDALEYCNWLSLKEGLSPVYVLDGEYIEWNRSADGYRLPTEAEWEYACRAGTLTPFSTGDNITTDQANYDGKYPYNGNPIGRYYRNTTQVGTYPPNSWGLYDMHGNAYEWCWDGYTDGTDESDDYLVEDEAGPYRIVKGGGWGAYGHELRSAFKVPLYYADPNNAVGFRIAKSDFER
ncbi:formylglycine-generating enzyme family protein [Treponema sp. OttesenSCG-928-L16]|nr:formylglycine-generating enzyme family protein [Treponema sp. OttesenSCG-928-L16]